MSNIKNIFSRFGGSSSAIREVSFRPSPWAKTFFALLLMLFASQSIREARAEYKIGPDDLLRIKVWRFEDLSGDYRVNGDGFINHFLLGSIDVSGKTAQEVQDKITELLGAKYLRKPKVKVAVAEPHNFKIYLMGEVNKPGMIEFNREVKLLDALLAAGGPTDGAGDTANIFRDIEIEGKTPKIGPKTITINLSDLLLSKSDSSNIDLRHNDIILVASDKGGGFADRVLNKSLNRFYVVGQVKTPGAYQYRQGYTVLNAILDAGGLAEFASPGSTRVVRGSGENEQVFEIELGDILYDGDRSTDIEVKPGDLIIVPRGIF